MKLGIDLDLTPRSLSRHKLLKITSFDQFNQPVIILTGICGSSWLITLQLVLFLFVYGHTVAFYGDLLMNHYNPYFSNAFYRLVRLSTVVQTLKFGKSKVELVYKNIWLVNMWPLHGATRHFNIFLYTFRNIWGHQLQSCPVYTFFKSDLQNFCCIWKSRPQMIF